MKKYKIRRRYTQEVIEVEADSAQEACQKAGWLIGFSWVREIPEKAKDNQATCSSKEGNSN